MHALPLTVLQGCGRAAVWVADERGLSVSRAMVSWKEFMCLVLEVGSVFIWLFIFPIN